MRLGRHKGAATLGTPALPELSEATEDLVDQLRALVQRLDRSARIGKLAVREQQRSAEAEGEHGGR